MDFRTFKHTELTITLTRLVTTADMPHVCRSKTRGCGGSRKAFAIRKKRKTDGDQLRPPLVSDGYHWQERTTGQWEFGSSGGKVRV